MPPIADMRLKKYVTRILENMSPQELIDFNHTNSTYSDMIKKKINDLVDVEAKIFE